MDKGSYRAISPDGVGYVGLDGAKPLITLAKNHQENPNHQFLVRDVTKPFRLEEKGFSHAVFLLSLQNMKEPEKALIETRKYLKKGGSLLLVLNHPCFRIPRQTSWGIDEKKKCQYRRIDRYMSPMEIPIQMHPGKKESIQTFSYHHSLSDLSHFLHKAKFVIKTIDEWTSHKQSSGKKKKMENRAREEIPLFLAIHAI